MTKAELTIEYVNLLSSTLNRNSKFFREDYQGIVNAANNKTSGQLLEGIQRWKAINSTPQSFINAHCQFGGLNKVGNK